MARFSFLVILPFCFVGCVGVTAKGGSRPSRVQAEKDRATGFTVYQLSDPEFQQAVQRYRAAKTKPELPEDARRYQVQAEAAVQEKRYQDAIDRYGKALRVAPWWPDGYYNRAKLLAHESRYSFAVMDMKRYLQLVPNSPDAREAQNQIYQWEDKPDGGYSTHAEPAADSMGSTLFNGSGR